MFSYLYFGGFMFGVVYVREGLCLGSVICLGDYVLEFMFRRVLV